MVTDTLQEIHKHEAKLAELKSQFEAQRAADFKALPGKYGYDSVEAFIKALKEVHAAKPARGRSAGAKAAKAAKPAKAPASGKKRTRAIITDEIKAQVKSMVADDKTGAEISKALGISLPSVQNIKKALGLVKARAVSAS